jgi:hypothetical protein
MGAFYVNYTVKGSDQKAVHRALFGRNAFVSPERNGYVAVFDEESDNQNQKTIANLARQLSAGLSSTVLAVLNHDSDILWYQLYDRGTLRDEYNTWPDYWSQKPEPVPPAGGDAKGLCAAFKCGDILEVENTLRASRTKYPDATARHADLFRALELPSFGVGYGFAAIAQGHFPEGLSSSNLMSSRKNLC